MELKLSSGNYTTFVNMFSVPVFFIRVHPDVCSAATCMMECPNGFNIDANGCQTCTCLEDNQSVPAPTFRECPVVACQTIACPDGFEVDADGCSTCKCAQSSLTGESLSTRRLACGLPAEPGPCRASKEYFYFNTTTNQCQTFIYGGCDGTANRFATKEQCSEYCEDGENNVTYFYQLEKMKVYTLG
jgi:hypothetical protein